MDLKFSASDIAQWFSKSNLLAVSSNDRKNGVDRGIVALFSDDGEQVGDEPIVIRSSAAQVRLHFATIDLDLRVA